MATGWAKIKNSLIICWGGFLPHHKSHLFTIATRLAANLDTRPPRVPSYDSCLIAAPTLQLQLLGYHDCPAAQIPASHGHPATRPTSRTRLPCLWLSVAMATGPYLDNRRSTPGIRYCTPSDPVPFSAGAPAPAWRVTWDAPVWDHRPATELALAVLLPTPFGVGMCVVTAHWDPPHTQVPPPNGRSGLRWPYLGSRTFSWMDFVLGTRGGTQVLVWFRACGSSPALLHTHGTSPLVSSTAWCLGWACHLDEGTGDRARTSPGPGPHPAWTPPGPHRYHVCRPHFSFHVGAAPVL